MTFGILETLLCVLFAALIITVLLRQFKIPVVLGYFVVGALLGPHALHVIPDLDTIKKIAEFGIVFLMFTVGLEFSQPKLFALKKAVFLIGGLQVLLSVIICTGISMLLGMNMVQALVIGGIVAMSSTAIVIKQLDDQFELYTSHGLNAIGILIFQDLAVIPFFILIVGLSVQNQYALPIVFLSAVLKGTFAIFLIVFLGQRLLKPAFQFIAKTRALELFTLTVLLIALFSAWLTNWLGLSFSLGAFLAGMMLSETTFHHQIEIEIRPFRDILLGLFFITIGMLVDIKLWHETWYWIALLLCAIVIGKMGVIILISRLTGNNSSVSLRTGLVLAQGGEFGFAILTLALTYNIISVDYGQVILAALLISIAISPLLIYYNQTIAKWILPKSIQWNDNSLQQYISQETSKLNNHIIICGFGRVGQDVAKILNKILYPYIGLDIDSELIKETSLAGENVLFGDASHPGILKAAGLERAKAIVVSFDKLKPTQKVLSMVREEFPTLPIFVRCKDQIELEELKKYQPTKIVAETFEESLSLAQYLLSVLSFSENKIHALMAQARRNDYDILRKVFVNPFKQEQDENQFSYENLMPIQLLEDAYAVGHTLDEFNLEQSGIELIGIRRGKLKLYKPEPQFKLQAHDIIVVYGPIEALENTERFLLEGKLNPTSK